MSLGWELPGDVILPTPTLLPKNPLKAVTHYWCGLPLDRASWGGCTIYSLYYFPLHNCCVGTGSFLKIAI